MGNNGTIVLVGRLTAGILTRVHKNREGFKDVIPPMLDSAQSFAVLGYETVTNGHVADNPTTQIYGNLGVTPDTSVTGFYPDGTVSGGTIHINDGVAQLALASISLDPMGEILCGRAFALTGVVTLIDNLISNDNTAEDFGSGRSDFGSYGFSGSDSDAPASVPEPATMLLFGTGIAGLAGIRMRGKRK